MATIADLHTSVSEMSEDRIFSHIRTIRSLRRELPSQKVTKKKAKAKVKIKAKQMTIDEHLININSIEREKLLKKLLELKGRKKND